MVRPILSRFDLVPSSYDPDDERADIEGFILGPSTTGQSPYPDEDVLCISIDFADFYVPLSQLVREEA